MNSFRLIILSLFILSNTVSGQNGQSKWHIGIEGGAGLSTIRYDALFFPSQYCEAGLGGAIGLSVKYCLNKQFSIKTNISYERLTLGNPDLQPDNWWNYINIPVLGQFDFGKSKRFYVELGPFFGLALSMNQKNYYRNFNCGLTTGIGFKVPVSQSFFLSFGLRNNLGLFNISKNLTYYDKHGNPVTEIDSRYTNSLDVICGITYKFQKK